MSILGKNKNFLKQGANGIYRAVFEEASNFPALRVERTKEGLQVMHQSVRCHLTSIYNKNMEYKETFASVPQDTRVIIYFGCFDPDLIRYLQKTFRLLQQILFVDPATQILQALLEDVDLEKTILQFPGKNLTLLPNLEPTYLVEAIYTEVKYIKERRLVCSLAYQTLFPQYLRDFKKALQDKDRLTLINLVTLNEFSHLWLVNSMFNYANWVYAASELRSLIQGKHVILVSAGPSLRKNVHLLKNAYDKAIIIAVGSSVPTLNHLEIRPHFNAGLDIAQGTAFSNLKYPDVPLLFGNKLFHETLEEYRGHRFCFVSEVDYLDEYLWADDSNKAYVCNAGISVATSVLSLVSKLGAKSVIFIGQDMCLYDNKLHLVDNEDDEGEITRDVLNLTDIYGQPVLSPQKYWAIKPYLENVIRLHPEVRYINATEGGLGLEGAENDTLEHVLSQIESPEYCDFQAEIERIVRMIKPFRFIDKLEEKNVLLEARQILDGCEKIEKSVFLIGKMKKNHAQDKNLDSEVSRLERMLNSMKKYSFYGVLRNMLNARFGLADAEYKSASKSKDPGVRREGKISYCVAVLVPVKVFCEQILKMHGQLVDGEYTKRVRGENYVQ